MPSTGTLEQAQAQFAKVLESVGDDAWTLSTPCAGWDVRELVGHLIGGALMAVALLDGVSKEEAIAGMLAPQDVDLKAAYAAAATAESEAFRAPGALEQTVHHPIGDVSGAQLRDFRIGDATLHSWDLARALGIDETLDPELVEVVWNQLEPLSSFIGSIGVFGEGPSGSVAEDAELQVRLLDLSGRRP
jgi:uncharacterized protein (TIGR03086 family)